MLADGGDGGENVEDMITSLQELLDVDHESSEGDNHQKDDTLEKAPAKKVNEVTENDEDNFI
jgi:hypothetical protein